MEKVTHSKMNSRERGSFLSLEGNQTIRWEMEKEKKRKKGNRMKKKKGRGGKPRVEENKKKKGSDSWCSDLSEVVSPRIKVGLLDESYE